MARTILVLVVDDFPDGRELVAECLTSKGFAVLTASTAAEAIEIARRVKPQIVLMDLSLPGVDGLDKKTRGRAVGASSETLAPNASDRMIAPCSIRVRSVPSLLR